MTTHRFGWRTGVCLEMQGCVGSGRAKKLDRAIFGRRQRTVSPDGPQPQELQARHAEIERD